MTLQQLRYVTAVADAGTISRAALFNLLIGLDGYTICSGVISEALNGPNIVGTVEQAQTGQGDRRNGLRQIKTA